MGKKFQIRIDSLDLGQVIDGLRSRYESWSNTAIFLRDGYYPDDGFVCEECSNPNEAERIANDYQQIIGKIEQQVNQQGGW